MKVGADEYRAVNQGMKKYGHFNDEDAADFESVTAAFVVSVIAAVDTEVADQSMKESALRDTGPQVFKATCEWGPCKITVHKDIQCFLTDPMRWFGFEVVSYRERGKFIDIQGKGDADRYSLHAAFAHVQIQELIGTWEVPMTLHDSRSCFLF